ncbi:hypothetical protein [Saccharothrix luteola]|uniref:hypothetical protein n=1 Tax=Saccharothrix luteola TaxID=2893018 RepID=UPI001E28FBAB|nr:hypothetical protein [Saccharothrix luteola]MCC8243059.1 hypothetical protein [Saccharothrix luteola]
MTAASAVLVLSPAAAQPVPAAVDVAAVESDPGVAVCCSKTVNNSQYSVLTYRHWTCDWGTTGSSSTGCTDLNGGSRWLVPGERSPLFEDWDVLRVDAGWCYQVEFSVPGKVWTLRFDQSGLGDLYVKIEDWGTAFVQAQRYRSCP